MSLTKASCSTMPLTLTMAASMGGVGEVAAQFFLADPAGINGAHTAGVALQQGAQLSGVLAGVDDNGALGLQTGGDVHGGQQGLVNNDHVIGKIDVGVHRAALGADAVVGGDGRAHALGAVFGEALHVFAGVESGVSQQQGGGFGALTAAAVSADLYHIVHRSVVSLS